MGLLPSEMTRDQFIATFQTIYENVPDSIKLIPDSAYETLTNTHDTPTNLHKHLSKSFNALSEPQKLAVLKAYPRLAHNGLLSKDSAEEQASRGLDRLPEDTQARFDHLNDQYDTHFGWPFIVPVKDHSVTTILDAMQNRLESERDQEFEEACRCVVRIAEIRIIAWFQENNPAVHHSI